MSFIVLKPTKWLYDAAANMIKADVHLSGTESISKEAAVIFVANRPARLDALLLAFAFNKWAVQTHHPSACDISLLFPNDLLMGRIGRFLRKNPFAEQEGNATPDATVQLLLKSTPFVLFPAINERVSRNCPLPQAAFVGEQKQDEAVARPALPMSAPALALETELLRLRIVRSEGNEEQHTAALQAAKLPSFEAMTAKRTLIVPLNITYFPIRSRENLFLRIACLVAKDPSRRSIESFPTEGTVLAKGTDVHIALGEPIDVTEWLGLPEQKGIEEIEPATLNEQMRRPDSFPSRLARALSEKITAGFAKATTINPDHILACLVRHQWGTRFSDQSFRNRAFLATKRVPSVHAGPAHPSLQKFRHELLHEEPSPLIDAFLNRCIEERVLDRVGKRYWKLRPSPWFPSAPERKETLIDLIADEIDPISPVTRVIQEIASTPAFVDRYRVRKTLMDEDRQLFEEEYAAHYESGVSKAVEVGRPFLMKPLLGIKGGIVLIHGYMAAPLEVRMMADFLKRKGYAVYSVRLRGHGTSPADLATRTWEEWYASIEQGCAVIQTLTDNLFVGGFSMGAGLALLAAGLKKDRIKAVFAIDAPMYLRSSAARFAPSIVRMNALLKRVRWGRMSWEYVENSPENKHINYFSNPVSGVAELTKAMHRSFEVLPDITAPTLIMQGSKDPLVSPESAAATFEKVGSPDKILIVLERDRHGIINGAGAEDVFRHVQHFLKWARMKNRERKQQ